MDRAITVYLYGSLGKQFGKKFTFFVEDAAEALRAMCAQFQGFRAAIQRGSFAVRSGREYYTNETVADGLHHADTKTLHITPVVSGANAQRKNNRRQGWLNIVIGVIMIVAAFYSAGTASAAIPGVLGGLGMILGGVALILTKVPDPQKAINGSKTTSFSNLDNTEAQGRPVPLVYGEMMVGSRVLSQGIRTYEWDESEPLGVKPAVIPPPDASITYGLPKNSAADSSGESDEEGVVVTQGLDEG